MELDRSLIEAIVRKAIEEKLGEEFMNSRQVDASGVIQIRNPRTIHLEPFPFPIESDRVSARDILSLEESPRLGCGILELDTTRFAWTLNYDEIDYVLEGTLEILLDGRTVSVEEGNIVFIPKGTKLTFSAPGKTRFLYICYPANWAEQ